MSAIQIQEIRVRPRLGQWVENVARAMVLMATEHGCPVSGIFNGAEMRATPGDDVADVLIRHREGR
jgi:hypothetical protein